MRCWVPCAGRSSNKQREKQGGLCHWSIREMDSVCSVIVFWSSAGSCRCRAARHSRDAQEQRRFFAQGLEKLPLVFPISSQPNLSHQRCFPSLHCTSG